MKKLNSLYNGNILIKEDIKKYINLSNHNQNQDQKEVLNLELNY